MRGREGGRETRREVRRCAFPFTILEIMEYCFDPHVLTPHPPPIMPQFSLFKVVPGGREGSHSFSHQLLLVDPIEKHLIEAMSDDYRALRKLRALQLAPRGSEVLRLAQKRAAFYGVAAASQGSNSKSSTDVFDGIAPRQEGCGDDEEEAGERRRPGVTTALSQMSVHVHGSHLGQTESMKSLPSQSAGGSKVSVWNPWSSAAVAGTMHCLLATCEALGRACGLIGSRDLEFLWRGRRIKHAYLHAHAHIRNDKIPR